MSGGAGNFPPAASAGREDGTLWDSLQGVHSTCICHTNISTILLLSCQSFASGLKFKFLYFIKGVQILTLSSLFSTCECDSHSRLLQEATAQNPCLCSRLGLCFLLQGLL